jgi:uncharacterized protein YlzI (FlbEa/FlbD family)
MRAKQAILTMLIIVAIFVSKGLYTSNILRGKIDQSYREFEVVTNTLSPLFDSYGITLVDSQVKVSHDLITIDQFRTILDKTLKLQHGLIDEYKKCVVGFETIDDKELFLRAQRVAEYIKKIQILSVRGDVKEIHAQLYNGEMYRVVDPMTEIINKILENKFDAAENSRKLALAELQAYEKVVYFTAALTIILGVALYRCKCDKLSGKKPRKVKRVNKNRKF